MEQCKNRSCDPGNLCKFCGKTVQVNGGTVCYACKTAEKVDVVYLAAIEKFLYPGRRIA